jgi:hypothetical protein
MRASTHDSKIEATAKATFKCNHEKAKEEGPSTEHENLSKVVHMLNGDHTLNSTQTPDRTETTECVKEKFSILSTECQTQR